MMNLRKEIAKIFSIEELAKELHRVYQQEAHRTNDIRYDDDYDKLPENFKGYYKALAKYIVNTLFEEVKNIIIAEIQKELTLIGR